MVQRWLKEPKYKSRAYNRYTGLCRICFRELALTGELPGVRKASW